MHETIKEVLNAIRTRFSKGRENARVKMMVEGNIPFDYSEVISGLESIINHGGSDRCYNELNDKIDAKFYIDQLTELQELI
jgi:hypothetical protein